MSKQTVKIVRGQTGGMSPNSIGTDVLSGVSTTCGNSFWARPSKSRCENSGTVR